MAVRRGVGGAGAMAVRCGVGGAAALAVRRGLALLVVLAAAGLPAPAAGQVLQGRVVDADRGRPVPQTMLRLVDADGVRHDLTVSDLQGGYRLEAPAPGIYRVEGERLGFENYLSPELEMPNPDGVYGVDLVIRAEPIPIRGLQVTARTREAVEDDLRLLVGVAMASIRNRPIHRAVIEDHLARGHDIADLVQWANLPSIVVERKPEGPCFRFRSRSCLPVYLNGAHQSSRVVPLLPLEMVEAVVVLQPGESVHYGGGAILLYTAGWLRR